MTREQLDISIQSNMPTNGVGFITAEHTRQVANDIADYVDSEIEDVEVDVAGLDGRMTQAETDINNLEGRVETAEGDIDSLEDRVGINEQDISQLKPVVAQHTTDINNLDGRMDTAEDDIDALETRVDGIGGDVTGLDSRVDTLEDKVDVLEPKVDQNTEDIDNIKTRVTQNERDINSLDGRMDTAEDDINNVEDDVNMAQRDITNLQGRMQRAEGDIQNIEANHYTKTESDGKYEQLMNKATDFTVINDVRYPTIKAVADYVEDATEVYYTNDTDTYQNVKNAVANGNLIIMKYLNGYLPLTRVYNAGQANEYYVFVGHFSNHSTMMIILNSSGWQAPETLALTTTITGYESADDLFPSVKAFVDWVNTKLDDYAKKDGYYETMGVGTANNLAGQAESINNSKFRTSGGTTDIGTGTMRIDSVRGNSIAYNQINTNNLPITNRFDNTNGTGMMYRSSGIYFKSSIYPQTGYHKVLFYIDYTVNEVLLTESHPYHPYYYFYQADFSQVFLSTGDLKTPGTYKKSYIRNVYKNRYISNLSIIYSGVAPGQLIDITYNNVKAFDLTLIYGAGNEPDSVEQFEKDYIRWFGKSFTDAPVDTVALKKVEDITYKTVGFNLLNSSTGKAHLVGTYGNTNVAQGLYCYEITGNYTSITDESGNNITPENGFFMVEDPQEITVEGADENTCIHLTWSGWRNGETEAYQEHLADIPVTQITGKLNGTGESVVIFPDGMKSTGDVYDELYISNSKAYAIKRVGSVNLGALKWNYSSSKPTFYSYSNVTTLMKPPVSGNVQANIISSKYVNSSWNSISTSTDMMISVHKTDYTYVNIQDRNYTDPTDFKTSLNGVMLYYELLEPQVYEIDNFELPVRTYVNDFGTEEQVSDGIAANMVVKYAVNAVDLLRRLPENYISSESMDNFLAALGAAMNGTWTKTWNSNNQVYNFSFVANPEPEPEPEEPTSDESTNSDI